MPLIIHFMYSVRVHLGHVISVCCGLTPSDHFQMEQIHLLLRVLIRAYSLLLCTSNINKNSSTALMFSLLSFSLLRPYLAGHPRCSPQSKGAMAGP